MKNTFKVLFYVKRNAVKKTGKAPIIARITVDQAISQFNTQLEIDTKLCSSLIPSEGPQPVYLQLLHGTLLYRRLRAAARRHQHRLRRQPLDHSQTAQDQGNGIDPSAGYSYCHPEKVQGKTPRWKTAARNQQPAGE